MSFQSPIHWSAALAFAFCAVCTWVGGRRRVRGSTLIGPWLWTLGAFGFATLGAVYVACGFDPDSDSGRFETLSFAMATLFFCPVVSVLGAKRPQDKAWHLIVASLWMVLILPAAESALIRRGSSIQIHDARAWFLWALIVMTFLNYVFTRYVVVAVFCCAAIIVWLSPYLPGLRWELPLRMPYAALFFACAAVAHFATRSWKAAPIHRLDATWIDFRDAYGITWGLRVMERVNTAATTLDWPAKLEWDGFKVADDISDEHDQALTASFVGILRRFVREV